MVKQDRIDQIMDKLTNIECQLSQITEHNTNMNGFVKEQKVTNLMVTSKIYMAQGAIVVVGLVSTALAVLKFIGL